uniref:SMARCD3 n=1 Tax=Steinernema glaseri TaxID=37863 RepID=A0A1I8AD61_9BILA
MAPGTIPEQTNGVGILNPAFSAQFIPRPGMPTPGMPAQGMPPGMPTSGMPAQGMP